MGQALHLFIHTGFWGKVAVFFAVLQFFSHMIVYKGSKKAPTARIVVNLLFHFFKNH